jgi:hypothetical protein
LVLSLELHFPGILRLLRLIRRQFRTAGGRAWEFTAVS